MSHEPNLHYELQQVRLRNRKLLEQINLLYAELGWSEETIRKWESGELDAER